MHRRGGADRGVDPQRRLRDRGPAWLALLCGGREYSAGKEFWAEHPPPEEFTRLTRDIFIAVGEIGFWQGSFRDPSSDAFAVARRVLESGGPWMIDVLYSDAEGGQRVISRYSMTAREDGGWLAAAGRHWSIDGVDPRYG